MISSCNNWNTAPLTIFVIDLHCSLYKAWVLLLLKSLRTSMLKCFKEIMWKPSPLTDFAKSRYATYKILSNIQMVRRMAFLDPGREAGIGTTEHPKSRQPQWLVCDQMIEAEQGMGLEWELLGHTYPPKVEQGWMWAAGAVRHCIQPVAEEHSADSRAQGCRETGSEDTVWPLGLARPRARSALDLLAARLPQTQFPSYSP